MGRPWGDIVLVAVCCLTAACGDSDTRVCFGSTEFCRDAFARNQAPRADAGPDHDATAGDTVQLDGSASRDADGRVASYSWTQEAGPPVALTGASQAVAEFVAPGVDAETVLDFRLVVTDNDGASDADRVRITVVPVVMAALRAGVARLGAAARPRPGAMAAPCGRCWASLGLWLGARVRAAEAGADPDIDGLLDELRMLEIVDAARVPEPELPAAARRLFELGQLEVAAFTGQRDPATAERAARSLRVQRTDTAGWRQAVAAAYPALGWDRAPGLELEARARALLSSSAAASPDAVAAATLLLTLAVPECTKTATLGAAEESHCIPPR